MLASFFFSLLAGFLTLHIEGPLGALLEKVDRYDLRLDPMELRILTFGFLLLLAAIATALVGADSSAYLAVSGGLLGYFGGDLYAFLRDPDGARGEDADDWDGDVTDTGERRSVGDHLEEKNDETLRAVQAAIQDETNPEKEKGR